MNIKSLIINKLNYMLSVYNKKQVVLNRSKYWRNDFSDRVGNFTLDSKQIAEIKKYYGRLNLLFDVSELFHTFYTEKTGIFDLKYIPDDIYYCYIDPYFNKWDKALVIDNKCLYPRLFAGVRQPEMVLTRVNGIWTDSDGVLCNKEKIKYIVKANEELVIKQANESEGGKNIFFISGENITDKFFDDCKEIKNDIVVQKVIKQHKEIAKLNSSSINTIRILSMLSEDGVKIYSAIIRMGINGSRVDNVCSGGVTCGIDENGRLKGVAYTAAGEKFTTHPSSGVKFDTVTVPSFDKACELVRKIHPSFSDFRLVSWDIAITEDAEPLLIEANFRYGELDFHQLNNGPVFGDDTEKILNKVFGK